MRSPAFLASLVAAGPSAHEATSFTAYATLPLSRFLSFRSRFGLHEDLPREGAEWEPPVVLMPARWPRPGEPDEAVIAEAIVDCLTELIAAPGHPLTLDLRARLAGLLVQGDAAASPASREPA